jgi:hypothetical protein
MQLPRVAGVLLFVLFANISYGQQSRNEITRLSFGRVMPDQVVEEVITFQNLNDKALEIENIQLTPPLLAEDVTRFVLPGAEGSFKLVLGPDRSFGLFEGVVHINFKTGTQAPIAFEVEGFVIPPIEFKPYPAFFVTAPAGTDKTASIEIINHKDEPLLLTGVESGSDRFTTELESIEKGRHYRLSLTLDGTAEAGRRTDEITLVTSPPMDKPLRVQANTYVRTRVYNFPDTVDMGALPYKIATDAKTVQSLSQTLMVYRPNTRDFKVEATVNLDFVSLESERGPDGDRYQLTLTLMPEKVVPGKIDGVVRIKTNDKEFGLLEVPVSGYIMGERGD